MPVGGRVIKAIDIVRCIRSGMSDAELMEQFSLSAQALQNAFKQLESQGILVPSEIERRALLDRAPVELDVEPSRQPNSGEAHERVKISAKTVLADIKAGMKHADLMKKFNLSVRGLQSLFAKLLDRDLVSLTDLEKSADSKAGDVVLDDGADTRFGMADPAEKITTTDFLDKIQYGTDRESLMEEYDFSTRDLSEVLKRLVTTGQISRSEMERKLAMPDHYFEIKHRTSQEIVYWGEAPSMAALVAKAVALEVDLSGSDLSGAMLARTDLSGAILENADLRKANLVRVDLTGARLAGADLGSADLSGAILFKANLAKANLSDASLSMVNATWAILSGANLSESNFTKANLSGANLSDAELFETILSQVTMTGTSLHNVDLRTAKTDGVVW